MTNTTNATSVADTAVESLANKHGTTYTNRHFLNEPRFVFTDGGLKGFVKELLAAQPQAARAVPQDLESLAINRYRPVPAGVVAYKVVAGDGERSLFSGTKDECQIIARRLTEAFLDGAHAMLAAAPCAPAQPVLTQAARDVLAERQRQITAEGWTPEHDDEHDTGELAGAAACYAGHVNARQWVIGTERDDYASEPAPDQWPWDEAWWKPKNPRRDAIRAAALLIAEIERLDRAARKEQA